MDTNESNAYFITLIACNEQHAPIGSTQYSQCPLIRHLPKSSTQSKSGTDSQLVVWYNQYHMQVSIVMCVMKKFYLLLCQLSEPYTFEIASNTSKYQLYIASS